MHGALTAHFIGSVARRSGRSGEFLGTPGRPARLN